MQERGRGAGARTRLDRIGKLQLPATITQPCHARVLEGVGPSKGNGTQCPLLRNFKVIRISQKLTTVSGDVAKTLSPFQQSGVVPARGASFQRATPRREQGRHRHGERNRDPSRTTTPAGGPSL